MSARFLLPFTAVALVAAPALSQPTCTLPVSAYLTDDAGEALVGAVDVELRFYTDDAPGTLASECRSFPASVLNDGWLRLIIDACSLPPVGDCGGVAINALLADGSSDLWVGVIVGGTQLEPLLPVGSVPYALRAVTAGDSDRLQGRGPDSFEPSGAIEAHTADGNAHHSETSDGLELTPAGVNVGATRMDDGAIDFGPDTDDELTAEIVRTLTGGGEADALHSHTASADAGGGCMTAWGRADCPAEFTLFYVGETVQNLAAQQNDGAPETISLATSQIMCFDPGGLPTSASYDRSYFTWGLMRVGARLIYTGTEAIPCAVCCR